MKSIAVFNNKGGVGKTTLIYHLGYALAELGHKTLLIDLDPQCNLTLFGLTPDALHDIWSVEDPFIDDFRFQRDNFPIDEFNCIATDVRSIHFLLKPTEDGVDEPEGLAKPLEIHRNLDMIPGRLSLHMFEDKIASRWSEVYRGDPPAIRLVNRIRHLCIEYAKEHSYKFVLMDTSPNLGMLNRVIVSTSDGFIIPCMPDMFSLYGIQNIGKALTAWKKEFDNIFSLLSPQKRYYFPKSFVTFLGFTIYNAKKYTQIKNPWNLSQAHYNYARLIPTTIRKYISYELRQHLSEEQLDRPIGSTSIMYSHSTLPTMAQKYRTPMWKVPSCADLDVNDRGTISGNREQYEDTKKGYHNFAEDLLERLQTLEDSDGQ
jgi:cellulose biosynthesis protein BcsQ